MELIRTISHLSNEERGLSKLGVLTALAGSGGVALMAVGIMNWDSDISPDGDLPQVTPVSTPVLTRGETLARVIPTPTPRSMLRATSSPELSATVVSAPATDPSVRRTENDENSQDTFMREGIDACSILQQGQVSARPSRGSVFLVDGVLNGWRSLSGFFAQTAEAGPLEAEPKTFEQFILCIQAIEEQRPFLTSEQHARKNNFKKIDVTKWKAENVLDLDSIANWQKRLLDEVRKRGYNINQAQINAFLIDTRWVTFINPAGFVQVGHIDSRSPETLIWIALDPDTNQLVFALEKCDNVGVPTSLETPPTPIPATASPTQEPATSTATTIATVAASTATPEPATATSTASSTPEPATATSTASSTPEPATVTPRPTITPQPPIPTATGTSLPTMVPQRTPLSTSTVGPPRVTDTPWSVSTRIATSTPRPTGTPVSTVIATSTPRPTISPGG